jgi:hypothetical protein
MDETRDVRYEDEQRLTKDDDREFATAPDDEVPFHIPRD